MQFTTPILHHTILHLCAKASCASLSNEDENKNSELQAPNTQPREIAKRKLIPNMLGILYKLQVRTELNHYKL